MELRIKEILKERNMKITELAEAVGVSQGAMSLAINGNPTLSTLKKIADALNVQVVDLFENRTINANCPHCGKPISIEIK